ncbi:MAG: hypothetical protein ACKOPK_26795, partial [Dolichospermum sp.]
MDINGRQREWKRIVNEKNIEETMKSCIEAIFSDLGEKLKEFEQEYEYDLKNIQIDMAMNFQNINKDDTGKWILMNGNQTAVLAFNYLLEARQAKGIAARSDMVITTVVTTPMIDAIAKHYGVSCYRVLT